MGSAEAGSAAQQRQLRLAHVRTLRMADDVLCCKISPDGKLLAVALLDATIKVCVHVCACVYVVCVVCFTQSLTSIL